MVDAANSPLQVAILPALARRCGIDFVDAADPVRRECIAPDGVRLNYLDWGGSGDPIVFLHGGAFDASRSTCADTATAAGRTTTGSRLQPPMLPLWLQR
jgi:hypothetical protein